MRIAIIMKENNENELCSARHMDDYISYNMGSFRAC